MTLTEAYQLNNGLKINKIGFGTWLLDNHDVVDAVKKAIKVGYRHIDTAEAYGNEEGVGRAVRESGIAREKLFVTTKLRAEMKNYDDAVAAINDSLKKLNIDYIDLMLIHSPKPWAYYTSTEDFSDGNLAAWRALEEAYEAGKIKAIGVANFEQADLQNLIDHAKIMPMVDQVLAHIGNTPLELIMFAQKQNILVEAHSPFGHGDLIKNDKLQIISDRYHVTVSQLAVRYLLQLGLLPLPKASSIAHMKSNTEVDFTISDDDMLQLKYFKDITYSSDTAVFPVYQK
ncbi:aldo/keto reductase [Leuconostoc gasicomitatum]|uniref:Aldo/keto reductase n=1 Tax=Leuconostoc gasicomitatum TaxID=115778 RepID=A0A9Q3SYW9_9LACO|nr:aldo/keto reductase [Leuconostoc gasicomitatum]MBZ5962907.1 aldo/keto reductase [Leuconostoc gasicomitatum]